MEQGKEAKKRRVLDKLLETSKDIARAVVKTVERPTEVEVRQFVLRTGGKEDKVRQFVLVESERRSLAVGHGGGDSELATSDLKWEKITGGKPVPTAGRDMTNPRLAQALH